jgi:VIT1/CCC1 family predicted Fe2+/Mn2+ transporter
MSDDPAKPPRRLLDPVDRFSEILFGLIMVLSFTGSLSAASAGRAEVRTMLFGALGCNLAWGIVDGIMYILSTLGERGRGLVTLKAVRKAADPAEARRMISDALPPALVSVLRPEELDAMHRKLKELPEPPARPRLYKQDLLGALAVCVLVFFCTFPVTIPFIFMGDPVRALRLSNGIAIAMLFMIGHSLGRHAGYRPWRMGLSMVVLGIVLVAITMALGG